MNPTPLERTEQASLTSARFEDLVQEMLVRLGEDPNREGLAATPERVHKAMKFLTKGYQEDPEALLKGALFTVNTTRWSSSKTSKSSACASITFCPSSARCT